MVVPIFNSMMRIDKRLVEAAYDSGASAWQTLWNLIIPLSKPGIVIGSIFVVTIVMGDFITFDVMGGEQIASAGKVVETRLNALQFPPAAANAVILLAVTLLIIVGSTASSTSRRSFEMGESRSPAFYWLAAFFAAFVLFLYGPDDRHLHSLVSGSERRPDLPVERCVLHWFERLWHGGGIVDISGAFERSLKLGSW